jgi:uncharacterized repeat protein (TIGR01451 family)
MREPDFAASADMRLLELQRDALGLPARDHTWQSRSTSDGIAPVDEPDMATNPGAVLTVEAVAHPPSGVIAGAIVTLTLSIANEGTAIANDVVAGAPLPGGATYRPGTFVWNGRSTYDDVADSFFGAGLEIGAIAAGERATFQWKIGVRLGAKPLAIAPQVRAKGSPVLGGRPLSIARKEAVAGAFGTTLMQSDAALFEDRALIPVDIPATDLPIYELDDEEQMIYEAAEAALSSDQPKTGYEPPVPEPEPKPIPAVEPEPQPIPAADPEPESVPALEPEPAVAAKPAAEPAPAAVVLYGRFDRTTLAFFERVLHGSKPPTILQHSILGGALACSMDARGEDGASLKRHLDAQSQVLHRIVLHEKLGKKEPIADYAGEMLAQLDALIPTSIGPGSLRANKDALTLIAELSEPTRAVLARLGADRDRWDFVKARQLTLALQAASVTGDGVDPAVRTQIEGALRAYAQASVTVLQRLFVRIRIDRSTGLLSQTEPALDGAASALMAALKLALA